MVRAPFSLWLWLILSVAAALPVVPGGLPAIVQALAPQAHATEQPQEEEDLINPDRPGIAEGSTVVKPGWLQLEMGLQQEFRRESGLKERQLLIPTLLRFGLAPRWEARVESNTFTHMRTSDGAGEAETTSGVAPVSLGVKYHIQEGQGLSQPSLGMLFRLFPPSGSGAFRTRHVTGDARLALDWDLAPHLSLNPNVGIAFYEDDRREVFVAGVAALTLTYSPTKTFGAFVDMGFQGPEERRGKSALILDVGVTYLLSRHVQLDVSYGTGLLGQTPPDHFVAAGVSVRHRLLGGAK